MAASKRKKKIVDVTCLICGKRGIETDVAMIYNHIRNTHHTNSKLDVTHKITKVYKKTSVNTKKKTQTPKSTNILEAIQQFVVLNLKVRVPVSFGTVEIVEEP